MEVNYIMDAPNEVIEQLIKVHPSFDDVCSIGMTGRVAMVK